MPSADVTNQSRFVGSQDDKMQAALCNVGSDPELRDDVINAIEIFICKLYVPETDITTMVDIRWLLFIMRQYTDEPPNKGRLSTDT